MPLFYRSTHVELALNRPSSLIGGPTLVDPAYSSA